MLLPFFFSFFSLCDIFFVIACYFSHVVFVFLYVLFYNFFFFLLFFVMGVIYLIFKDMNYLEKK